MLNSNEILDYLSRNKIRLQQEYHLVKIGLFGSLARNENNPSSDIDIIIEFEENTNDLYTLKRNLKDEIQSTFNVSVDICREKYIKPVFREQIIAEARYV
jgi:uncharacterized protein